MSEGLKTFLIIVAIVLCALIFIYFSVIAICIALLTGGLFGLGWFKIFDPNDNGKSR